MAEENKMLQSQTKEAQSGLERAGRRYGYSYEAATADRELNLNQYLKVLLKYKRSIITCIIIVMVITALGLARTRPTYEAMTVIQIDPEKSEILGEKSVVFQNWLDPDYYNTQLKLLTSPSLAREVVKNLDLDHNPDFLAGGPATLSAALFEMVMPGRHQTQAAPKKNELPILPSVKDEQFDPNEAETLEPLVGQLLGGLQVAAIQKTRLVQITYRHQNPQVAQKVANGVANAFILNNLNRRIGTSKSTSAFLQKRVAELQTDIHHAEEELINYGRASKIVSLEPSQNTVVERLAMLNRQVLEAESARKEAESIYRLSRDGAFDTIPEVQASSSVQALQARLSSLKQKHAELIVQFTEDWPEVKQVEQTMREVEEELQTTKKNIVAGIETRYRAALEREKLLRSDLDSQLSLTLNQNESAIGYKIKQQDLETKKELYKTLLARLKEVDVSAGSETNNISIADFATQPKAPVSPRVPSTLFFAFVASLFGSIGLAFMREYLDNRIKTIEDVDRFIHLPTLGLIPAVNSKTTQRALKTPATPEPFFPATERRALLDNVELVAHTASNSSVAESYRQLRTSVLLSSSDQPNKVILVTSSQPGEGKTTTALNTAISLAQTGARTVLIDCDLRNPRIQQIFDVSKENGLSNYLSGQCQIDDLIREQAVSNLTMILCGPLPPNPAELLGSQRMKRLIERLTETHDYVVIDSPPILSFADSIILSSMADGVLLVIHGERSGRDVVQRARRSLEEANARVLGVVLNSVSLEHNRYGYYYNYYGDERSGTQRGFHRAISALKTAIQRRDSSQQKEEERVGRNLEIEIKTAVHQQPDAAGQPAENLSPALKSSMNVGESLAIEATQPFDDVMIEPIKRKAKKRHKKKNPKQTTEQPKIGE